MQTSPALGEPAQPAVLLVDDRPENILALEAVLESLGLELVRATSGEEALRQVLTREFAVILMDVQMPGMDGFETARRINERERSRHTPIIFLTALGAQHENVFQGYEVGAVDYVTKPFPPEVIRAKVRVFAELKRRAELLRAAELREAELRHRTEAMAELSRVFAQAPIAIAVLRGPEHVYELANPYYVRLLGVQDAGGKPVRETLSHLDGDEILGALDRVFTTGEPFVASERRLAPAGRAGAGGEVLVNLLVHPLAADSGEVDGLVVVVVDVTSQVRARREVEAASRAKSQFMANMSHELRTPLNAILGYLQLLEAGVPVPLAEGQRDYVARTRTSAEHLLALVNDVLDLAKADAGEVSVTRQVLPLRDAHRDALTVVLPQAQAKGIEITADAPCPSDAAYRGDADRVRQIVVNLLSNAVKFTGPGGRVGIRCGIREEAPAGATLEGPGPWAYVEVADTGIGIEPDQVERVFEAFAQVDDSNTREQGGTGLGLTISRHLARLMGGDLTLRSQPGEGSTFTLVLPAG